LFLHGVIARQQIQVAGRAFTDEHRAIPQIQPVIAVKADGHAVGEREGGRIRQIEPAPTVIQRIVMPSNVRCVGVALGLRVQRRGDGEVAGQNQGRISSKLLQLASQRAVDVGRTNVPVYAVGVQII